MLNMNFSRTVTIDTRAEPWQTSPRRGVWRKPLAREEKERGHATSIVRYEPGASFHSHNHPGGEEILVLEGTFSDETGDFGRGTYFRNPAGFVHAPFSREGCLILVKLHQFDGADQLRISVDTDGGDWQELADGVMARLLHEHGTERVQMVRLNAGSTLEVQSSGALEWYLLDGALQLGSQCWGAGTWRRSPADDAYFATEQSLMWLKTGHFLGEAQIDSV